MKHLKIIGVFTTLIVAAVAILNLGQSFAATTAPTETTLGITTGPLSFYKDTGTNMNIYFSPSHSPSTGTAIDIGTYAASFVSIAAQSSGDHRFTVSDLAGNAFAVTLVSSDLTALDQSGVTLTIIKANISYTGTDWMGTGVALTATGDGGANIGTLKTFVGRSNNLGLSNYSQEITIKVAVPAAQAPGAYTGLLTFTY